MRLEKQTIKELKQEAAILCLDTSKCIEKKDLVDLIVHKKKSPSSEKDGKYSESNSKESSPYTIEKRTSRCRESEWFDCNLTDVENLRYDIDGTCIYQLKFDMTQHMRSTLDWKTVENLGYIKPKRIRQYKKKSLLFRKFSMCK